MPSPTTAKRQSWVEPERHDIQLYEVQNPTGDAALVAIETPLCSSDKPGQCIQRNSSHSGENGSGLRVHR